MNLGTLREIAGKQFVCKLLHFVYVLHSVQTFLESGS